MVNIFTPFAYGTKVFAQEWANGKYITSTIFYVVNASCARITSAISRMSRDTPFIVRRTRTSCTS